MKNIIEENEVGIAIDDFREATIQEGIINLIELAEQEDIIHRCRMVAEKNFALNDGIENYMNIYNNLLK